MKSPALLLVIGPALVARLLAAEGEAPASPPASDMPAAPASVAPETAAPSPELLALGERVYQADCANCHVRGKAGAPRVGAPAEWTKRLAQGRPVLLKHAIEGHYGPDGDEMPARGGNDELTDAEVAATVDHIVRLVTPKT